MRARRFLPAVLALALLAAGPACRKNDPAQAARAGTPAQELYDRGMVLLEKGRYYRARVEFERAMSRPDVSREIVANSSLAMADAYFQDGGIINIAEALSRYTSFLTFYPTHAKADYAQYRLATAYLKQALAPDKDQATTRKALEEFRKVWRQHPDSDWAEAARGKAEECRERLAESELRVAFFYKKRKAYPGAVERLRVILDEYPGYTQRDRVLFELADSLRESRKADEALIYLRRVVEEHPESKYAARARHLIQSFGGTADKTAEAPANDEQSSLRKQSDQAARSKGE